MTTNIATEPTSPIVRQRSSPCSWRSGMLTCNGIAKYARRELEAQAVFGLVRSVLSLVPDKPHRPSFIMIQLYVHICQYIIVCQFIVRPRAKDHSIAGQDHVLDQRINLRLPAPAAEDAVVADAELQMMALEMGAQA